MQIEREKKRVRAREKEGAHTNQQKSFTVVTASTGEKGTTDTTVAV